MHRLVRSYPRRLQCNPANSISLTHHLFHGSLHHSRVHGAWLRGGNALWAIKRMIRWPMDQQNMLWMRTLKRWTEEWRRQGHVTRMFARATAHSRAQQLLASSSPTKTMLQPSPLPLPTTPSPGAQQQAKANAFPRCIAGTCVKQGLPQRAGPRWRAQLGAQCKHVSRAQFDAAQWWTWRAAWLQTLRWLVEPAWSACWKTVPAVGLGSQHAHTSMSLPR